MVAGQHTLFKLADYRSQPLAVMEAMKMEDAVSAPCDGKVAELAFAVGDHVGDEACGLRSNTVQRMLRRKSGSSQH